LFISHPSLFAVRVDAQVPSVTDYTTVATKLQSLEAELAAERARKEELTVMLEDPSEATVAARCHPLPGDIPDEDQLAAKVDVLQEKLNEKRELLLERNLVLDEVVSLVDTLRTKAADGRCVRACVYACSDFEVSVWCLCCLRVVTFLALVVAVIVMAMVMAVAVVC
jgi:hypothetical protein